MINNLNIFNLVEEFKAMHNTPNEYDENPIYRQAVIKFVDHVIRLKNDGHESPVIARMLITLYSQIIFRFVDTGRADLQSFVTSMIEIF